MLIAGSILNPTMSFWHLYDNVLMLLWVGGLSMFILSFTLCGLGTCSSKVIAYCGIFTLVVFVIWFIGPTASMDFSLESGNW